MKRILWTVVVLLVVAGCSDAASPISTPSPTPTPVVASETPARGTPEDVVRDSRSRLLDAVVRPAGDGFKVTAWWGCVEDGCRGRRAIATSNDGFETAVYEKWTSRKWLRIFPLPAQGRVPAFDGLSQETVPSIEVTGEGQRVVIAGGDGATLKPFQVVARSSDHGEAWTVFEVQLIDGELASYSGAVALPDGRLLVLLDHFSDDRANAPADRPHGLWVSPRGDWSTYAPYEPVFTPPLNPTGSWGPIVSVAAAKRVIWVRTWDSKLYVSTDYAATFTEIAARPS